MPVTNREIAEKLKTMADLLEIDDANQFRVRAYRSASDTIKGLTRKLDEMLQEGEALSELPDIGDSIADKIVTIVETGKLPQLEKLRKKIPAQLQDLLSIESLGPKKVGVLYRELDITSIKALKDAAAKGEIEEIYGFGEKTQQKILEEIDRFEKDDENGRFLWTNADETAEPLTEALRKVEGVDRVITAGSYRRKRETVGDLDILVTCNDSDSVMEAFTSHEDVERVVSHGSTRSTVIFRTGIQVDLRAVDEKSYGATLLYFTGSKAHNVELRTLAQERDYKINEYGVFEGETRLADGTEKEIYELLDLRYIEPELRENRGEIEAAREDRLPNLIETRDIKGDLQTHTDATDGKHSLEDMANAAQDMGYEYLAITDHSKRVSMAGGLDEEELSTRLKEIDRLNNEMTGLRLLKSVEVDILKDGSLDLHDDILRDLDLVVAAVHYDTDLPSEQQTERILRGLDNPNVNILAHPTGRLIRKRRAIDFDLDRIMRAAMERGCFMEINAQPQRMDLNDRQAIAAKEMGLKLAISTDAHSTWELSNIRYGVSQARRGWLEASDIVNTRSWEQLKKLLQRK